MKLTLIERLKLKIFKSIFKDSLRYGRTHMEDELFKIINKSVEEEYSEQTAYGNLYYTVEQLLNNNQNKKIWKKEESREMLCKGLKQTVHDNLK